MKVEDKLQPIHEGEYYAVEYQKAFYIGQILRNKNATLTIKFLHSVGTTVFTWPKCDSIDDCSPSRLIFDPLQIQEVVHSNLLSQMRYNTFTST